MIKTMLRELIREWELELARERMIEDRIEEAYMLWLSNPEAISLAS